MYVETGNITLVSIRMASTISAVQMPRPQHIGDLSPFCLLSLVALRKYIREIKKNQIYEYLSWQGPLLRIIIIIAFLIYGKYTSREHRPTLDTTFQRHPVCRFLDLPRSASGQQH